MSKSPIFRLELNGQNGLLELQIRNPIPGKIFNLKIFKKKKKKKKKNKKQLTSIIISINNLQTKREYKNKSTEPNCLLKDFECLFNLNKETALNANPC